MDARERSGRSSYGRVSSMTTTPTTCNVKGDWLTLSGPIEGKAYLESIIGIVDKEAGRQMRNLFVYGCTEPDLLPTPERDPDREAFWQGISDGLFA